MTASVHIVIVNWNTGHHLRQCLDSVARADRDEVNVARVTVIDNASTDGSATHLDDLGLPMEVVHNRSNIGFAAACNQGATGSEAHYLLFLNPDTRLFPETLAVVTRFMESEQAARVGICGAQLLDPAGGAAISCARFPTLPVVFGEMTGLNLVMPRTFPSHQLTAAEIPRSGVVDQVIGAFFLVRRKLFIELGGFDTRYFLYYEEVDFSLRALRHGYSSYFLKEARVLHAANVSSEQVRDVRLYHSLRSRLVFARRHWPSWKVAFLVALTLGVELPARLTMAILRRSHADLSATASGYRMLIGDLTRGGRGPTSR
jgi:N-acetylglucosaminyl-diphospho-decaprenol L-rhamnosyltransferase